MKILSRLRTGAKKLMARSSKSQALQKKAQYNFTIEEIEPRILYSADNPLALLAVHSLLPTAVVRVEAEAYDSAVQPAMTTVSSAQTRTLIVVDIRVENSQKLIEDLRQSHQLGVIDILMIDQNTNALGAIANFLGEQKNPDGLLQGPPVQTDRLIVLSHGSQGLLELGDREIDSAELIKQQAALEQWRPHLAAGADILLYGCDAGGGQTGIRLTQTLARLTGADVAASIDATGNLAAGGNWNLEQTVGNIRALGDLSADWLGTLATHTVTTNANSGVGSLRQAILDANSGSGDNIVFNLSSSQLTITPTTALPSITSVVSIDGTNAAGNVAISGLSAGSVDGLRFENIVNPGASVSNLVLREFTSGAGIAIISSEQVTVQNSFIGTNRAGLIARANLDGIRIDNSANTIIRNNVISGNTQSGIAIFGSGSVGANITDNIIGLDFNNALAVPNQGDGIAVSNSASNNTIRFNTIAFNAGDGVNVASGAGIGNTIQQNAIFGNGLLGIDLSQTTAHDGINSNDNLDADLGVNGLQNSSDVLRVYSGSGNVTVDFDFSGAANTTVRFDYYWSDPSDGNAARNWFGTSIGLTNNLGRFSGSFSGTAAAPTGSVVRMIVTGLDGSSSEISNGLELGSAPLVSGLPSTAFSYVENSAPIAILNSLVITPTSSQLIYSTQIQLTANFQLGADQLTFVNTANLTGNWNAATGVLSFVPVLAGAGVRYDEVQTALRSVRYANTSDNPGNASRGITVTLGDQNQSSVNTVSVGVTPVNDAAVVAPSGSISSYTEQAPGVAIMNGTTLADPDSASMTGAVISISTGANTGDVLSFVNTGGITGTYNAATFTLTLTGSASTANYQTALRSIQFSNLTNDNPNASKTLSVQVNDGSGLGAIGTRLFTIDGVNDAPVVATSGTSNTYTEQAAPTLVMSTTTLVDVDSANMTSAVISIAAGTSELGDVLGFTAGNGITGTYNAATFTLTLTGTSSAANYQTALRSVVFSNSTSDNPITSKTLNVQVNDGAVNSTLVTRVIAVTRVNDSAVVTPSGGVNSYTEQAAAVAIMNGTTLADPDSASMTGAVISISTGANTGDVLSFVNTGGITGTYNAATFTLTLTGSASTANYQTALRSIQFSNLTNDNPNASKTLSVQVNDGSGLGAIGTRLFTIDGVNDAPVVATSGTSNTYTEQAAPTLVMSTTTLVDVDSANMTSAVISIAAGTSELGDVLGFTAGNGITGTYNAATFTLTLTGTSSAANYQTALRSVVFSNSTSDNPITSKTLNVQVNDGAVNSTLVTRVIAITRIDDTPIISGPTSSTYIEDAGSILPFSTLTITDPDTPVYRGATIQITSNYEASFEQLNFLNTVEIAGNWDVSTGKLTLTAASGVTIAQLQAALRSVTFDNTSNSPSTAIRTVVLTVNDGTVLTSSSSTLQIIPTNDAPVLTSPNPLYLFQGTRVALGAAQLSLNDTDSPDSSLMFNVVTAPQYGRFELRTNPGVAILGFSKTQLLAGDIFYQHFNASQGTDSFILNASDSADTTANITANIIVTLASNPIVMLNSAGVAFIENASAIAIVPSLTITDLGGNTLNRAVVTITGNFQATEDQILFTDQNGIVGTIVANTLTLNGSATLAQYQTALRSIQYRDTSDTPTTLNRAIEITVHNGPNSSNALSQVISVTATNDAPTVQNAANFVINEGANRTITVGVLRSVDPDNSLSEIVYTISTAPTNGWLSYSSAPTTAITSFSQQDINNGLVRYTHFGLENTSDSFAFQVSDGIAPNSAPQVISITVTSVNDPASIVVSGSVSEYVEQAPGLAIFDTSIITDPDSSTLTGALIRITSIAGADLLSFMNQSGIVGSWNSVTRELTLSGSASVAQYQAAIRSVLFSNSSDTPNPIKSFSIQIDDGNGLGLAALHSISVTAVNDVPVVAGTLSLALSEGASSTISSTALRAADPDAPNANTLVFTVVSGPMYGQIELAGSPGVAVSSFNYAQIQAGQIIYVHNSSEIRTDSFTLRLSDGVASTSVSAFNISLTNVDDAPMVTATPPAVFVEDGPEVQVFANLAIVDPDTPIYTGAIVSINTNFVANKDNLSWVAIGGLTVNWNASTGFLSVSGAGSASDYISLLQSVKFSTTEQNPQVASREIYFSLISSSPNTASLSTTVLITAVNDAPEFVTAPNNLITSEDAPIIFTAANLISITDVDLHTGNISVSLSVSNGTLSLVQTVGINFTVGDAGPNGVVSFFGSLTNVNAALNGMVYNPRANFFGSDSLQIVVNDNGGTGTGAAKSVSTTIPIVISAVNDPALVIVNTGAFVAEGGVVTIDSNVLRVSDLEQTDGQLVFTVSAPQHGYLALNGAPSVPIFSFTMQQINAGLINYHHDASQTLADSFTFVVSDGIQSTSSGVFAIQVDGVNDTPLISAPPVVQITEGIDFVFNGSDRIQIADPDAGSAIERVSINLSFGTFSLSRTTGLTFLLGDGASDQSMVFTGTLTAINLALDGMVVAADVAWTSGPILSIGVDDLGNSGSGGAKQANITVRLNLNLVDDTPTLTSGSRIVVAEGQSVTLTTSSVVVIDPDTPFSQLRLSLAGQPSHGYLSVAGVNNATSFTWQQLNAGQVRYIHDGSQTLADQLQIFASDLSTSSSVVTIGIDVTPVNNPATLNLPVGPALSVNEQIVSSQVFSSLQIDDVDNTTLVGASIQLIEPPHVGVSTGQFVFAAQNGITGSWNATTATLTLSGVASLASYEFAIRSIQFIDSSDNPSAGARFAVVRVDDGASISAVVTRQINLISVNDGPRLVSPSSLTVLEDTALDLSAISIDDPDSGNSLILLRLTATNGFMSFGTTAGLTFLSGDGLQDQAIVLTGTQVAINAAIDTLVFQGNADYFGVANIQVEIDDLGNTGTGGAKSATQNIAIDIRPVNDSPVLIASVGILRYNEGRPPLAVDPSIIVQDVDSIALTGARIRFTSGYVFGEDNLSFTDTVNLRGTWNAVSGVLTVTGTATAVEFQNALRSVTYQNLSDSSLSGTKLIAFDGVSDSVIGLSSNEVTRTLQYTAVNDVPVLSGVVATIFSEGNVPTSLFASINLVDVDSTQIAGVSVQLTLGYDRLNDQLQWTNTSGVTVLWDATTGTLTASGSASVANYQSFLRSIAFKNSSEAPVAGARAIQLRVTDFEGAASLRLNTQVTVVSVNDAPTLDRMTSVPFNEGQVLRFGNLDNAALALNDVDSGQGTLVFEISSSSQVGQFDTSFVTPSLLSSQPVPGGSMLRLTGTLDQLQAELHKLQFKPQDQFNGIASFTASITDNLGSRVSALLNMTYLAVDDSPVLTGSLGSLVLSNGNQPAIVLAPDIVIADPDSTSLSSATLQVSSGYQVGDLLRLVAPAGFSSSWDSRSGTLTVSGPGTVDQYRTILRTATFETTSEVTQDRLVSIAVKDSSSSAAGVFERRLASVNAFAGPTAAPTPAPAPAPAPAPIPAPVPAPTPASSTNNIPNVNSPSILETATPIASAPGLVGNLLGSTPAQVQTSGSASGALTGTITSTSNNGSASNRLASEVNNLEAKNFNRDFSDETDPSRRIVRGVAAKGIDSTFQTNEASAVNSNSANRLNSVSNDSSSFEIDGRAVRSGFGVDRESNAREGLRASGNNSGGSGAVQSLLQKRLQKGDDSGDAPVVINVSRADELKVDLLALPVQGGGVVVSAVVLWWLTRAGGLLTALLAAIPTWQNFDPLPILGPTDRRDDDDDDEDEGEDKVTEEDLYEN